MPTGLPEVQTRCNLVAKRLANAIVTRWSGSIPSVAWEMRNNVLLSDIDAVDREGERSALTSPRAP